MPFLQFHSKRARFPRFSVALRRQSPTLDLMWKRNIDTRRENPNISQ